MRKNYKEITVGAERKKSIAKLRRRVERRFNWPDKTVVLKHPRPPPCKCTPDAATITHYLLKREKLEPISSAPCYVKASIFFLQAYKGAHSFRARVLRQACHQVPNSQRPFLAIDQQNSWLGNAYSRCWGPFSRVTEM